MNLHLPLLRWLMRPLWALNITSATLATLWVLFTREALFENALLPAIAICLHSILVINALYWGGERAGQFGFLQATGYSFETLWWHRFFAALCSAGIVLLPIAALLITPLRALFQDRFFENPYFPIMAAREKPMFLLWLGLYALMLAAGHYAWIRRAQPVRHSMAGHWLFYSLPATLLCAGGLLEDKLATWHVVAGMLGVSATLTTLFLFAASVHSRTIEVTAS